MTLRGLLDIEAKRTMTLRGLLDIEAKRREITLWKLERMGKITPVKNEKYNHLFRKYKLRYGYLFMKDED